MFEFLKNKLKDVVSKFSKKIDQEAKAVEEPPEKPADKEPAKQAPLPVKPVEEKKPEPKLEPRPEPRPEPKPELKVQSKPESKAEPKPEPKPEVRPEPKPEVRPEPKPEPKPELKVEPKPEQKPEPKPEIKIEHRAEPRPEPRPEPKPELKVQSKPESKAEPKPEPKFQAKPETQPEPKSEIRPSPQPQQKQAQRPETKPEATIPKEATKPAETERAPVILKVEEPRQVIKPVLPPVSQRTEPEKPKQAGPRPAEPKREAVKPIEQVPEKPVPVSQVEEPKPAPKEPEKEKHSFFDFFKRKPKEEPAKSAAEPAKEAAPAPESPKPQQPMQPAREPAKPMEEPAPKVEDKPVPHKAEAMPEKMPERPEPAQPAKAPEEPRNFFSILKEKITKKELTEAQFEELFWDLEMSLLENNIAVEVIDKIKQDLKKSLVDTPLDRNRIDTIIESTLKHTIEDLFKVEGFDLVERAKAKKPYIICFVGINGSGKTTTIAKIAHLLKRNNLTCVMAASDTFRAAAIQQLEEHADRLSIKLIKHDYGADSAAVAFDAISHAKAHNIDVVLIDTAGRLQSNTNLMDELKKVVRITKPDLILFIGESITGNDCVEQAKTFNQEIGIDGIILSKSDIDEKGGAAISVSYVTKKPILYLGTGQGYDDLIRFDPKIIIASLGLEG